LQTEKININKIILRTITPFLRLGLRSHCGNVLFGLQNFKHTSVAFKEALNPNFLNVTINREKFLL